VCEVKHRISEELLAIIKNDGPNTTNFSNTAVLYMNRQTCDRLQRRAIREQQDEDRWPWLRPNLSALFGIPIVLYHGIPIGRWELVQRISGENITSGNMWEGEQGMQEDHFAVCCFNPFSVHHTNERPKIT
jgi:hypothetical protein